MDNGPSKTTKTHGIRVLLFSQYPMFQEGLRLLIESDSDFTVIATHATSEKVGGLANIRHADVAVVDVSRDDRPRVISDLLQKAPALRIVVMVEGTDLDSQALALELGAVGIVKKEQSAKLLLDAIRQTYKGETSLNQRLLNKILERDKSNGKQGQKNRAKADPDSLTARELEVVKMLCEGLTNKEAAGRLSISEATVRHHLSSIYGKIRVDDRLNLVILAYQRGFVNAPDELTETVE